jgi:hypothetical protein
MSVFEDVTLEWEGKSKTVPHNDVMRMLAKVEDQLTLHEMQLFRQRGTAPLIRVSMAYACALRHAGFEVSDDEVYKRIMDSSSGDQGQLALMIVSSLQSMMVPPANLDVKQEATSKKPGKGKAVSNSSKKRTEPQSG